MSINQYKLPCNCGEKKPSLQHSYSVPTFFNFSWQKMKAIDDNVIYYH